MIEVISEALVIFERLQGLRPGLLEAIALSHKSQLIRSMATQILTEKAPL